MATYRYVWSKHAIITEEELAWSNSPSYYIGFLETASETANVYYWNGSTDYNNSQNWVFSGTTLSANGKTITIPAGKIFLITFGIITGIRPTFKAGTTLSVTTQFRYGGRYEITVISGSLLQAYYNNVQKPGPAYDYVASNYSASYPNDGISGSYWYKYLGMENIDATSISYPTSIRGGDQIQLAFNINGLYFADKESVKIRYQLAFDRTYGEIVDITVNNNNKRYY